MSILISFSNQSKTNQNHQLVVHYFINVLLTRWNGSMKSKKIVGPQKTEFFTNIFPNFVAMVTRRNYWKI